MCARLSLDFEPHLSVNPIKNSIVEPQVSPILVMQSTVQPRAGPPWGLLQRAEAMSSNSSRTNTTRQMLICCRDGKVKSS